MKKAFSLIELLVSLIIISCVVAVLTPVLTKKIRSTNVALSTAERISQKCDEIDPMCSLCLGKQCIICSKSCPENQFCEIASCSCKNCIEGCRTCANDEKCIVCRAGYGLVSSICQKCSQGQFSSSGVCTSCPKGKYQDELGATGCKDCPNNYVSTTEGAIICTECRASENKVANAQKTACVNVTCSQNQYIENAVCKNCPEGQYQDANNHQETSCKSCPSGCAVCSNGSSCTTCKSGYNKVGGVCKKALEAPCVQIGNICVAKFNAGDPNGLPIPSSVSWNWTFTEDPDYDEDEDENFWPRGEETSGISTCWHGGTAAWCDGTNGGYSGCNRTVCTYNAARSICQSAGWRLPRRDEFLKMPEYSINKGASGLQLCNISSGEGQAQCHSTYNCPDAASAYCTARYIWGDGIVFHMEEGNSYGTGSISYDNEAFSVRCVLDL